MAAATTEEADGGRVGVDREGADNDEMPPPEDAGAAATRRFLDGGGGTTMVAAVESPTIGERRGSTSPNTRFMSSELSSKTRLDGIVTTPAKFSGGVGEARRVVPGEQSFQV